MVDEPLSQPDYHGHDDDGEDDDDNDDHEDDGGAHFDVDGNDVDGK